jgi:hypothetical protein
LRPDGEALALGEQQGTVRGVDERAPDARAEGEGRGGRASSFERGRAGERTPARGGSPRDAAGEAGEEIIDDLAGVGRELGGDVRAEREARSRSATAASAQSEAARAGRRPSGG